MPDRDPVAPPLRVRPPLTGRPHDCPRTAGEDPAAWLHAIADRLSAAGFQARLDDPQAVRAVTVTAWQPGRREADIILDEDGYAELRWWPGPDATPADVITRALTVIAAPPAPCAAQATPVTAQPISHP